MKLIKYFFVITFLLFSCDKDTAPEDNNPSQGSDKENYQVPESFVQKGPFIQGSNIIVQELNDELNPNGTTFSTTTNDDKGSFNLDIEVSSANLEIIAEGYYFNETTGELDGEITLRNITNIENSGEININILTTLAKDRIENLILNSEMSFEEAKKQAQKEILKAFGIHEDLIAELSDFEKMDLSQSGDSNAILLAISLQLQQDNNSAQLSELIAKLTADFKDNGVIDSSSLQGEILENNQKINVEQVKENISQRNEEIGVTSAIPNFEDFIDSDGDGILNVYDFSLINPSGVIQDTKPTFTWTIPADGFSSNSNTFTFKIFDQNTGDVFEEASGLTEGSYTLQTALNLDTPYIWHVFIQEGETILNEDSTELQVVFPETYLTYPEANSTIANTRPVFTWGEFLDGKTYYYTIEVSQDPEFSEILFTGETTESTFQFDQTLDEGTYYWRVRYQDENGIDSEWSSSSFSFKFVEINKISPSSQTVQNSRPTFEWSAVSIENAKYTFELSSSENFDEILISETTTETSYYLQESLELGSYYWRVNYIDENGVISSWYSFSFEFALNIPQLNYPNEATISDFTPEFRWEESSDSSQNDFVYEFQLSKSEDFSDIVHENLELIPDGDNSDYYMLYQIPETLENNTTYYWRVRYKDSYGVYSEYALSFFNLMLQPIYIISPREYQDVHTSKPKIEIEFFDNYRENEFHYELSNDSNFNNIIESGTVLGSEFIEDPSPYFYLQNLLEYRSELYFLRMKYTTPDNIESNWTISEFKVQKDGIVYMKYPVSTDILNNQPTFTWNMEDGSNGNPVYPPDATYQIELYSDSRYSVLIEKGEVLNNNNYRIKTELDYITTWSYDKQYYYKFRYIDQYGQPTQWEEFSFATRAQLVGDYPKGTIISKTPEFSWYMVHNTLEDEWNLFAYDFEISLNQDFSEILYSENDIFQGIDNVQYQPNITLEDNNTYYWRIRFKNQDSGFIGDWINKPFTIDQTFALQLYNPEPQNTSSPFSWKIDDPRMVDGEALKSEIESYEIEFSTVRDFSTILESEINIKDEYYHQNFQFVNGTEYYWRLRFKKIDGTYSQWKSTSFNFYLSLNMTSNDFLSPPQGADITSPKPLFDWISPLTTSDNIVSPITWEIEIYNNSGNPTLIEKGSDLTDTSYTSINDLPNNVPIQWRIRYKDGNGVFSEWRWQSDNNFVSY